MHTSSLEHMEKLIEQYLDPLSPLSVIDVGSYDVNGCYRPLFDKPGWFYQGVDQIAGPNVDIVLEYPYCLPFPSNGIDLVISGQAFEHIDYFWLLFVEMARVLKPGGMIFLIAPSRGPEHRYPIDCWRFYPDGYHALAGYTNIELIEVQTDWDPHPAPDSAPWGDTVGVFRKPEQLSRGVSLRNDSRTEIEQLRATLNEIYSSISWRLTAPLRAFGQIFR